MTTLTDTTIQSTFKNLLQVSNVNQGIDTTVRVISDGEGTASQFFLSTTITRIGATGTLDFATGGKFDPTNMAAITGTWIDLGIVTTVDINGGTIDNATVGATTPSSGAFTTVTASTSVATDVIAELTPDNGVAVDGVLLKDNKVAATFVSYDNTNSGFAATEVQAALDETMVRASATTTDATKTLLVGIPVASGERKSIHVKLDGSEDASNGVSLAVVAQAFNTGGTTTLSLAATGYNVFEGTASSWTVEIEANNTTDEIEVNVTGLTATTIDWSVVVTEI